MKNENARVVIYDLTQSGITVLITLIICCVVYTGVIWTIGNGLLPAKSNGSLVYNQHGEVIGSSLIAQKFSRPEYLWSRPSAVDYNASASGGSNLSPANPDLRLRIKDSLPDFKDKGNGLVPADLVMASGSGLDPHISIQGAFYQAERVAKARNVDKKSILELIYKLASPSNPLTGQESQLNVLEFNILLDQKYSIKNP